METIRKLLKSKIVLSVAMSFSLVILVSICLMFGSFYLQATRLSVLWPIFKETNFLPFLLNLIPVFLFMLLIYLLFDQVVLAFSVTSIIVVVFSFVNRYKIKLRQDPFMPWDLSLFSEVITILNGFNLESMRFVIVALILLGLFLILCFYYVRNTAMNMKIRILGFISVFIISVLCNKYIYSSKAIFDSLPVLGTIENHMESFESKGFIYSFIYEANINKIKTTGAYNKAEMEKFIHNFTTGNNLNLQEDLKKPHVIMIMSEAFSEMSIHPKINFENYKDPLLNYKQIKKESIHGDLVVASIGGGTSDTEFDVLTGLSTRYLRGAPYSFRLVNKKTNSLASIFNELGYKSLAIHPGYAWFYNRANVYQYFGFSNLIDIMEFGDVSRKGVQIDETSTYDMIIQQFENHLALEDNKPLFEFCITIQNHGLYNNKYGVSTNFNTILPLNEDDINALSNYYEGLIDCDRELKRLYDYAKNSTEPIVIVYFGDHRPSFTDAIYENIVYEEDKNSSFDIATRMYTSPFIIWQNEEARKIVDFKETQKNVPFPDNMKFSANYLGAALLELLNFKNVEPLFTFNLQLMEKYPVILEDSFFDSTLMQYSLADNKTDIDLYKQWIYYRLFN